MDRRGYEQSRMVVQSLGYDAVAEPEGGEYIAFFDVVSGSPPVAVATVLNALPQAKRSGGLEMSPVVVAVQPSRITLEDVR